MKNISIITGILLLSQFPAFGAIMSGGSGATAGTNTTVSGGAVSLSDPFTSSSATITTLNISTIQKSGTPLAYVVSFSSFSLGASSATTSATFIPTGLKRTITPKSAQSCFEINVVGALAGSIPTLGTPYMTLSRNGANIGDATVGLCDLDAVTTPANFLRVPCDPTVMDSPATASPVTYEVYIRSDGTRTTTWGLTLTYIFIKEWSQCNF